jgi:hypothetical protein
MVEADLTLWGFAFSPGRWDGLDVPCDWSSMPARCSTIAFTVATCAALIASGGAGVAQARSGATTIATLNGDNQVRAFDGVQAWTDYNVAEARWHVVVRSAGQVSTPPAIAAGDERLAVDVGPDRDGRPTLAFVSCTDACRIVVSGLDGGGAQTVPGSEGASAPTIWGSRVAWVRGDEAVLTRDLTSGKVTRLPGVPRRKCYEPLGRRRCERPAGRTVNALELHGSRLALIVSYRLSRGGGNGQTELRMESVQGTRQRLVALMNVGEGGQAFVGPSWAKGKLFFYTSCPCGRAQGTYRFDPDRGGYAKAPGIRALAGFAMDDGGRRAFQALDPTPDIGDRGDTADIPTPLQLTSPLAFSKTRAPIDQPGA